MKDGPFIARAPSRGPPDLPQSRWAALATRRDLSLPPGDPGPNQSPLTDSRRRAGTLSSLSAGCGEGEPRTQRIRCGNLGLAGGSASRGVPPKPTERLLAARWVLSPAPGVPEAGKPSRWPSPALAGLPGSAPGRRGRRPNELARRERLRMHQRAGWIRPRALSGARSIRRPDQPQRRSSVRPRGDDRRAGVRILIVLALLRILPGARVQRPAHASPLGDGEQSEMDRGATRPCERRPGTAGVKRTRAESGLNSGRRAWVQARDHRAG